MNEARGESRNNRTTREAASDKTDVRQRLSAESREEIVSVSTTNDSPAPDQEKSNTTPLRIIRNGRGHSDLKGYQGL